VFVALGIHYAMGMHHIVMPPVVCLSVCLYHIFPLHLINGTIFGKSVAENKICGLIFCTNCLQYFSFQEELSEMLS
jgi:hypothetical protein